MSSIDYFIALMFFLICYGAYLKIWEQSRTTTIVFLGITIVAMLSKVATMNYVLVVLSMLMFMLFVRAVFRKRILKTKWKDLFYA